MNDDLLELFEQGYNLTEAEEYLSKLQTEYNHIKPIHEVGLLVTI